MKKINKEDFENKLRNSKRIAIVGGSGTGKTTLSNKINKVLNLPMYHIDGINYFENWKPRDEKERDEMIDKFADENEWILDGTYCSTLVHRFERADLIIYLDYSAFSQIVGILKRYFQNHGVEKEEIPGCKEQMTWSFFWFVLNWRRTKRNKVLSALNGIDIDKIVILKSRRQLNKLRLFE